MKYPLTILFIFFVDSLIAQTSYYQNVSTTSSVSLRNQLHELIDNHNVCLLYKSDDADE